MINRKFINRTGYTKGTTTSNNPVNIIPSQDITMKNVPYPIQATPLDKYGNPIGQSTMMMPEEDYFFENAAYVEERPIPEMQMGGSLGAPAPTFSTNTYNPESFLDIQKKAEEDMQRRMQGMAPQPQIENNGKPLYQFANPYSGQDFGSSLFNLGTSISEGNAEGIVSSGANVLFKGAKTFLSGLGSGNREQYNMQQFYDKTRQDMTGNYQYMQTGGVIKDKNTFKQIMEKSKIKSYIYNKETGNYEVEFE